MLRDLCPSQRHGVRGNWHRAQPAAQGGADLVPKHKSEGEALEAAAGENGKLTSFSMRMTLKKQTTFSPPFY